MRNTRLLYHYARDCNKILKHKNRNKIIGITSFKVHASVKISKSTHGGRSSVFESAESKSETKKTVQDFENMIHSWRLTVEVHASVKISKSTRGDRLSKSTQSTHGGSSSVFESAESKSETKKKQYKISKI
ncbi:hypothetical protein V1477_009493 [Vespula maculifrons]|uniref:Uncharacterized protein n=1 Tax=Vespula maculifrons TaxID=7453 RepID=A0ABD2C9X0_VESMC